MEKPKDLAKLWCRHCNKVTTHVYFEDDWVCILSDLGTRLVTNGLRSTKEAVEAMVERTK